MIKEQFDLASLDKLKELNIYKRIASHDRRLLPVVFLRVRKQITLALLPPAGPAVCVPPLARKKTPQRQIQRSQLVFLTRKFISHKFPPHV